MSKEEQGQKGAYTPVKHEEMDEEAVVPMAVAEDVRQPRRCVALGVFVAIVLTVLVIGPCPNHRHHHDGKGLLNHHDHHHGMGHHFRSHESFTPASPEEDSEEAAMAVELGFEDEEASNDEVEEEWGWPHHHGHSGSHDYPHKGGRKGDFPPGKKGDFPPGKKGEFPPKKGDFPPFPPKKKGEFPPGPKGGGRKGPKGHHHHHDGPDHHHHDGPDHHHHHDKKDCHKHHKGPKGEEGEMMEGEETTSSSWWKFWGGGSSSASSSSSSWSEDEDEDEMEPFDSEEEGSEDDMDTASNPDALAMALKTTVAEERMEKESGD